MQEIDQLRAQIDQLHSQMAGLLRQRLKLTEKIWNLKKAQQIALHDSNRENAIIHQFDDSSSNELEKIALQNFFKSILSENKKYLETKLK